MSGICWILGMAMVNQSEQHLTVPERKKCSKTNDVKFKDSEIGLKGDPLSQNLGHCVPQKEKMKAMNYTKLNKKEAYSNTKKKGVMGLFFRKNS